MMLCGLMHCHHMSMQLRFLLETLSGPQITVLTFLTLSAIAVQELLAQRKGAQHFDDAAAQVAVQEADANNAVELYGLQRVFRSGW